MNSHLYLEKYKNAFTDAATSWCLQPTFPSETNKSQSTDAKNMLAAISLLYFLS